MSKQEGDSAPSRFLTTAWSVIARAQGADEKERKQCLAQLCRNYWKPVYYYMRRRRLSHDDALDMTQEYFLNFLEKDFVAAVDRERGRFRTFVLVTVNRFLTKQLARRSRHRHRFKLDIVFEDGEEVPIPELARNETAEDDFNRRWALSLIETTLERMRAECVDGRRQSYYETFRLFIESAGTGKPLSYREIAEKLGVSEGDVTNFLHRGRNVFHKLLRNEIRQLVSTESEIDEEIEALKQYLRG